MYGCMDVWLYECMNLWMYALHPRCVFVAPSYVVRSDIKIQGYLLLIPNASMPVSMPVSLPVNVPVSMPVNMLVVRSEIET